MATSAMSLPILSLFLLLLSFNSGLTLGLGYELQKTWCVAKPSSTDVELEANLDFACRYVTCPNPRDEGNPCFFPDNLMNHASVVMNLYYQSSGRQNWNCNFKNSALVAVTDPSYGSCIYEYAQ